MFPPAQPVLVLDDSDKRCLRDKNWVGKGWPTPLEMALVRLWLFISPHSYGIQASAEFTVGPFGYNVSLDGHYDLQRLDDSGLYVNVAKTSGANIGASIQLYAARGVGTYAGPGTEVNGALGDFGASYFTTGGGNVQGASIGIGVGGPFGGSCGDNYSQPIITGNGLFK